MISVQMFPLIGSQKYSTLPGFSEQTDAIRSDSYSMLELRNPTKTKKQRPREVKIS